MKPQQQIKRLRSTKEIDVIKCSNIDSWDSKRHMLGDLTNGDNDDNDEGVNHGVAILATASFDIPTMYLPVVGPSTTAAEAITTLSTNTTHLSTIRVDKFNNAVGKAPHLMAIIPKKDLDWWMNRKMRKKPYIQYFGRLEASQNNFVHLDMKISIFVDGILVEYVGSSCS